MPGFPQSAAVVAASCRAGCPAGEPGRCARALHLLAQASCASAAPCLLYDGQCESALIPRACICCILGRCWAVQHLCQHPTGPKQSRGMSLYSVVLNGGTACLCVSGARVPEGAEQGRHCSCCSVAGHSCSALSACRLHPCRTLQGKLETCMHGGCGSCFIVRRAAADCVSSQPLASMGRSAIA